MYDSWNREELEERLKKVNKEHCALRHKYADLTAHVLANGWNVPVSFHSTNSIVATLRKLTSCSACCLILNVRHKTVNKTYTSDLPPALQNFPLDQFEEMLPNIVRGKPELIEVVINSKAPHITLSFQVAGVQNSTYDELHFNVNNGTIVSA